jgi:predicted RNase H-like HicB family nuclease
MENYAIVIHDEPEGRYWAEVPALPGFYSQGETMEQLRVNLREAINGVLAVMDEDGSRDNDQNG